MQNQEILLQHNRPLRIAGNVRIECIKGRVWLTMTDMAIDVFMHPGDSYALDWPGMVLVEALGRARIVLHPRASRWQRLISEWLARWSGA